MRFLARASTSPRKGSFFRRQLAARKCEHERNMRSPHRAVNLCRCRGQKNSRAQRARLEVLACEADTITFQEDSRAPAPLEEGDKCATQALSTELLWPFAAAYRNHKTRMSDMRKFRLRKSAAQSQAARSGWPALRFADDEVAENLHARHRLQLFGIDEISVELDRIRLAEQLHQPALFLDQIVRQCGDAEPLLAGAHQAQDVVDPEIGLTRARAVASGLDQPVAVLQMRRDLTVGQRDDAVRVELVERARRAEPLDVFRRAIGMKAHRE